MSVASLLLESRAMTQEQADRSREAAERYSIQLEDAFVAYGQVSPCAVAEARALDAGCRYARGELSDIRANADRQLLTDSGWRLALRVGALPVFRTGDRLTVLSIRPGNRSAVSHYQELFAVQEVEEWIVCRDDLVELVQFFFGDELNEQACSGHKKKRPTESAEHVLSFPQVVGGLVVAGILGVAVGIEAVGVSRVVLLALLTMYVGVIAFKFFISASGTLENIVVDVSTQDAEAIPDDEIPYYTILLPVYRERVAVPQLVWAVEKLKYPAHKLDVVLLVEEDDDEVNAVLCDLSVPAHWTVLRVPAVGPRTKPKACNYGLLFARGRYCVVYDAEDLPDPDQLLKTVAAFARASANTMCFQSLLRYYNTNQNLLTRLFSLEYHYLFDFMIPGLYSMSLPIPVGGTSNHFNVNKLKALGGWDPYNTTEFIDLGVRISVESQTVGVLRSTTYEEANSRIWNWVRQRTRWLKGQMQTFFVYNRTPFRTLRNLGLNGWLGMLLFVGGTPLMFLIAPLLWLVVLLGFVVAPAMVAPVVTPLVLYLCLAAVLLGNFMAIYMHALGAFHRRQYRLMQFALLNPLYWILHSVAAYRAVWQLVRRPHFWDKTVHYLNRSRPE